jgi:hypothetical protein
MFNLFKETWAGLRNLEYGNQIVKFPWKKVYLHWLSVFLWIFAVWLVVAISVWTYFSPQIKRLVAEKVPDIKLELKQKKLYTTPATPLVFGDSQSMISFENEAIVYKSDGKITKIDYPDQDFSITKTMAIDWIKDNKIKIWLGGAVLAVLFSILAVSSMIFSQIIGLLFWTIVFWIGGKLLSKDISYFNTLKICMYASIPGIIINGFGLGNTGTFGIIMPLVLFAWYSAIWIYKLPLAFRR